MRMAMEVPQALGFLPVRVNTGQGCSKRPERYPPPVKPQMSHGPNIIGAPPVENFGY